MGCDSCVDGPLQSIVSAVCSERGMGADLGPVQGDTGASSVVVDIG